MKKPNPDVAGALSRRHHAERKANERAKNEHYRPRLVYSRSSTPETSPVPTEVEVPPRKSLPARIRDMMISWFK